MKYLVIGLGNFGRTLSEELTDQGHEIIGIDSHETAVDAIKDRISGSYIMDASDKYALASLPLDEIDAAIVAIGQSMEISLRSVAALKELKVVNIYARAIDSIHYSILRAMSVDKIFIPESYAARIIASKLEEETLEMI